MPTDRPPHTGPDPDGAGGSSSGADGTLLDELAAFGLTLEHEVDDPIRSSAPGSRSPGDGIEAAPTVLTPQPTGRSVERPPAGTSQRFVWLAAAAALVAAVALGSYLISSRQIGVDPVGEDLPGVADDPSESTEEPVAESTAASVPILAADGTALASLGPDFEDERPTVTYLAARELGAVGFVDAAIDQLLGASAERRWEELLGQGLESIETSLDPEAQRIALDVTDDERLAGTPVTASLVTIEVGSGAVVAMIGDTPSGFSAATDGLLQPGSTVKTIVAAEAFEQGFAPADTVRGDGPCVFTDLTAGDSRYTVGGEPGPAVSIERALAESNNCAFVRLGSALETKRVAARFELMGLATLPSDAGDFASLPLGVTDVHLVELAAAYAGFANDGLFITANYVSALISSPGVGERGAGMAAVPSRQAVSPGTARLITASLREAVEDGTGRNARLADGREAAGKTGTTNDFTAGWFAGYTPRYVTVVVVTDIDRIHRVEIDGEPLTGGGVPAELWADYNDRLHAGLTPIPFAEPPAVDGEPRLIEAENEIG